MHDDLEEFINRNREAFNDEVPDDRLFEDIMKGVRKDREKGRGNYAVYWKAAAVFLFLLSAWLVFDKVGIRNRSGGESVYESAELREAERFYISVIDGKKKELIKLGRGEKPLENDFFSDLNVLDSAYIVLKKEIKDGNKAEIEDAMILNLQLRIEILNRQLNILKKLKNETGRAGAKLEHI